MRFSFTAIRERLSSPRSLGIAIAVLVLVAGGLALGLVLGTGGPSRPTTSATSGARGSLAGVSGRTSRSTTAPPRHPSTSSTAPPPASTTTSSTTPPATPATGVSLPPTTTPPPSTSTSRPTTTTTTAPAPTSPRPFGLLRCSPFAGVRFCPGGFVNGKDLRIPSFDGVPLAADVTLPATGNGPFPLLVLLHGWGGDKKAFESTSNDGRLDNVTMASQGWAVLTYTARGFGSSCGTASSRAGAAGCKRGWIQLADQRYEVRDTEYLAGLLVDQGLARPDFAVAGQSYGAGQALELAMLKNRERLSDGRLVPLTSPRRHVPMAVAAVYAQWPWDDLASALVPNGALSSTVDTPAPADITPVGVPKQSWISLLYATAKANYIAPPGADPETNLSGWYAASRAGEPYTGKELDALHILQDDKSAIGIPMPPGGPAPTAIQSGWTDTLFPVSEALHYANRVSAAGAHTPMLLMFADVGHGWAQNKPTDIRLMTTKAIAFLDDEVLHHVSAQSQVVALAQTCPSSAPSGAPDIGATLPSLQHGSVSLGGAAPRVVTSSGGSQETAAALDPSYAGRPLCDALPAGKAPGTAIYARPVGPSAITLLGAPSVAAHLTVQGNFPELVGRLWDVSPNGTRQIVSMGVLRPAVNQAPGTSRHAIGHQDVSFQLNPNDYTFGAGHTIELELVGSNAPYLRRSNGTFSITVTDLTASIPTR